MACFVQYGLTPLHYACRYGHLETAIALLDRGADIHAKNIVSIINTLYILRKNCFNTKVVEVWIFLTFFFFSHSKLLEMINTCITYMHVFIIMVVFLFLFFSFSFKYYSYLLSTCIYVQFILFSLFVLSFYRMDTHRCIMLVVMVMKKLLSL